MATVQRTSVTGLVNNNETRDSGQVRVNIELPLIVSQK